MAIFPALQKLTNMFIIWGQTHNQKKSPKADLKVGGGSYPVVESKQARKPGLKAPRQKWKIPTFLGRLNVSQSLDIKDKILFTGSKSFKV